MTRFLSFLTWKKILVGYFSVIFIFAAIYSECDSCINEKLDFTKSIYFSIVTITTLGYGEIYPVNELGYLLTSIETLTGIATFGLLLNEFTKYQSNRQEKLRQEKLRQEKLRQEKLRQEKLRQEKRVEQLKNAYHYFRVHMADFCSAAISTITHKEQAPTSYDMMGFRAYLENNNNRNANILKEALPRDYKFRAMVMTEYKIYARQIELACSTINLHDTRLLDFFYTHISQSVRLEAVSEASETLSETLFNLINDIMAGVDANGDRRDRDIYMGYINSLESHVSQG
ncbi:ion channel [Microbulbifer sp. ANSA005]|uniref:ion channel n=1 Tax=Microbulbifer sp. ANSA005 TaxID=3243362 RepID=UPI0040435FBC